MIIYHHCLSLIWSTAWIRCLKSNVLCCLSGRGTRRRGGLPNIREMLRLVSREEDWGEWTRAELSGQSEEQKAECKTRGQLQEYILYGARGTAQNIGIALFPHPILLGGQVSCLLSHGQVPVQCFVAVRACRACGAMGAGEDSESGSAECSGFGSRRVSRRYSPAVVCWLSVFFTSFQILHGKFLQGQKA